MIRIILRIRQAASRHAFQPADADANDELDKAIARDIEAGRGPPGWQRRDQYWVRCRSGASSLARGNMST